MFYFWRSCGVDSTKNHEEMYSVLTNSAGNAAYTNRRLVMLDHAIESKTTALRTAAPGDEDFERGVGHLLDSIQFIREYDAELARHDQGGQDDIVNDDSGTDDMSRSLDSFSMTTRDTRRIYDQYLADVEHDIDAMQRISNSSTVGPSHPGVKPETRTRRSSKLRIHDHDDDVCECGGILVVDETTATLICTVCALSTPYIEESRKALTHTEALERGFRKQFVYKRTTHFLDTLSAIQGRQRTTIPDEVISEVAGELKKYRIDPADATPSHVRKFLKRLGHAKYYEGSSLILNTIRGTGDQPIPARIEAELIRNFSQLQKPFELVSEAGRKNMLRYNYIIFKLLQLIPGGDEYLNLFPLLKSKSKLVQHDACWKRICEIMKWDFRPTV